MLGNESNISKNAGKMAQDAAQHTALTALEGFESFCCPEFEGLISFVIPEGFTKNDQCCGA